jgi:hypothetical protein
VLALVILQVFVISTQFTEYHRSTRYGRWMQSCLCCSLSRGSFEYFFCPTGYDQQDITTSSFYEIPSVLGHLEKVVDNVCSVDTFSLK